MHIKLDFWLLTKVNFLYYVLVNLDSRNAIWIKTSWNLFYSTVWSFFFVKSINFSSGYFQGNGILSRTFYATQTLSYGRFTLWHLFYKNKKKLYKIGYKHAIKKYYCAVTALIYFVKSLSNLNNMSLSTKISV